MVLVTGIAIVVRKVRKCNYAIIIIIIIIIIKSERHDNIIV